MDKLLERDSKLVLRPDGRLALDCDPDCCGPTECFVFYRFVPCSLESPDPACSPPPGEPGVIYICRESMCYADSPYRPGEPFPQQDPALLVIWYSGRCWRTDGGTTRPNLPPDATVLEAGMFRCMGRLCEDNPDCGSFQYAEAQPCNPAVPRPWPIYCPAGLPFDCSAVNPWLYGNFSNPNWNNCFIFRRDAPTQAFPPDTPIVTFNGSVPGGVTCCDCTLGCFRTGPLQSFYRLDRFFPGCCCGNISNAILLIDGSSYGEQYAEGPNGPYRNGEEFYTWSGSTVDGIMRVTFRQVVYNPDGSVVSDTTFPPFTQGMPAVSCPIGQPPVFGAGGDPSPQFDPFGSGYEIRTCTRYLAGWSGYFGGNPAVSPYGGQNTWSVQARVIGMVTTPGCGNDNCDGAQPATAPGTENGGVRIRGGGSRPVDPAVAAWMQQNLGGCRGCGDSPNPV